MRLLTNRAFALATLLPLTGFVLAGCPQQEASTEEVPYGQPASQQATPPAEAPPPGPSTMAKGPAETEHEGHTAGDDHGAPPGPAMGSGPKMGGPKMGGGPMMGGPMMGGGSDPMAPLTPTPELDKAIKAAEAKGDKKTIAAAYASRGYSRMTDDNAGQRIKYRKALEDFRTALKNDPANAKAKQNMAMIEDIYKAMGRPVPQ